MNLINKIGQRNFTKLIVVLAILTASTIYGLKWLGLGSVPSSPTIFDIGLGVILFSLSNVFLSLAAHKSTHYRLLNVKLSTLVFIINTLLFSLTLYNKVFVNILGIVSLLEILFSIVLYVLAIKYEKNKKLKKYNQKKMSSSNSNKKNTNSKITKATIITKSE